MVGFDPATTRGCARQVEALRRAEAILIGELAHAAACWGVEVPPELLTPGDHDICDLADATPFLPEVQDPLEAADTFFSGFRPGRTPVQQRAIRQELEAAAADWWETCCREQAALPLDQRDSSEAFKARTAVVGWLRARAGARGGADAS
jgi:hypothetical protein